KFSNAIFVSPRIFIFNFSFLIFNSIFSFFGVIMPGIPRHIATRRGHSCRVETDITLWGHRAVVLQNDLLRITVLAGRGADIVEFLYKPLDIDFMWTSPGGRPPQESAYPPPDPLNCFGYYYAGGWQELFPHGSK